MVSPREVPSAAGQEPLCLRCPSRTLLGYTRHRARGETPSSPPLQSYGFLSLRVAEPPQEVPDEVLSNARTVIGFQRNVVNVVPLRVSVSRSEYWVVPRSDLKGMQEADEWTSNGDESREVILRTLDALGNKVAGDVLWHFSYDISG